MLPLKDGPDSGLAALSHVPFTCIAGALPYFRWVFGSWRVCKKQTGEAGYVAFKEFRTSHALG